MTLYLTCGIEVGARLAEKVLAEDDAKHRVLGEPSTFKFSAPPKRIDGNGNEQSERRLRITRPREIEA